MLPRMNSNSPAFQTKQASAATPQSCGSGAATTRLGGRVELSLLIRLASRQAYAPPQILGLGSLFLRPTAPAVMQWLVTSCAADQNAEFGGAGAQRRVGGPEAMPRLRPEESARWRAMEPSSARVEPSLSAIGVQQALKQLGPAREPKGFKTPRSRVDLQLRFPDPLPPNTHRRGERLPPAD